MVYSNIRAQYPAHGPESLFSNSNSSLSSICSTNSYNMSSLTSTPASSTSSLSLPYLDQSSNKTLPALPTGIGSSFLQPQQQRFPPFQQHMGLPSPPSPASQRPTSYRISAITRKQTTIQSTKVDTPKKIPRPPNSFMIYRREQAALHRGLMASQLSMILGKKWEAEPAERKAHFARLARLAQEEHARRYPEYKFMPARRGTGKKAQMLAARKATGRYFASTSSATVHPNPTFQSAPSHSLGPLSIAVENNSRPLPALPHNREAQSQFISRQSGAPFHYSPSSPTYSTAHRVAPPLPAHGMHSSLLFNSFGTPTQNTFLALYSNPSPFTPFNPLSSGNSIDFEPQPPSTPIPTMYSSPFQGASALLSPCSPLVPSPLVPTPLLSQPFAKNGLHGLDWETSSQFEGVPPTQTAESQTYIAEAFKSIPGPSPSQTIYVYPQNGMPVYYFRPASDAIVSPSSSLMTLTSPNWESGPLSNGIMMENWTVQSPTLPYCSSLSTSASSSFTELSPLLLLNTPLHDPAFLTGQEKESFLSELPSSRII